MCNLFGGGINDQLALLMAKDQKKADQAATLALEQADAAKKRAEAALVRPADSESARKAAESRMRKNLTAAPAPFQDLAAPSIGYKMLLGA